ncbi:hypothetical protein OS493_000330 [Desmophyllum pertusum]|uniref:BEN domain-containing protein n=1 Tax=Desmophyllum pertusum TaxID=174260 RepID=A0A9X0DC47_9CNID|nr:hypothetical protein OS493_000330 [Desmophyllum pertusum]
MEDQTDAKSAVETLAKQVFTAEELQNSSVTGFQCNKAYESRPALSPRRRNAIECIVKKKLARQYTVNYKEGPWPPAEEGQSQQQQQGK